MQRIEQKPVFRVHTFENITKRRVSSITSKPLKTMDAQIPNIVNKKSHLTPIYSCQILDPIRNREAAME